jgi:CDP-diacylglycerol--glycerol-3-phosphate 3-phosphatidyltransferase
MNTNNHLIISGILFTIILILWPVFLGVLQPQGTDLEQLSRITDNRMIFTIQYLFAWFISPSIIYLMLSQLAKYALKDKVTSTLGFIFLGGYFVLNSIAYASQMILVPRLFQSGMVEHARVWYFNSSFSIAYFANQMGYCFWAIGTIILFSSYIFKKGMIKYLSIIYMVSAVLSIVAFAGLIIDNESINSMTLYSGLVLLPVGIMTTIWGMKEYRVI